MKAHDRIPVSLMLEGGDDQADGVIEEISRRARRVLWLSVRDGRKVVYKGLTEPLRNHPEEVAALRKEYLLALRIDSPYVVGVYGFEEHPALGPVIVMEYVDGPTLASYLTATQLFPSLPQRRTIACAIARAIAGAHAAGITHRDLKPDNILIRTTDLSPKIIDFGNGDSDDFVIYKNSLGTDAYGAPEQQEPSAAGKGADVYSFGKILDDLLPERSFRRLRNACRSDNPSQRPEMAQVIRRLERRGNRVGIILTSVIAAGALATAVSIGIRQRGEKESIPVGNSDTVFHSPELIEPQSVAREQEEITPSRSASRTAKPSAPKDSIEGIFRKYVKEADRINAGYGPLTYALELKPDNDRRRLQRGADHQALADNLDSELSRAGVDETGRKEAVMRLWTHIIFQTNKIDGVDEAREKIMTDYSLSSGNSE